MLYASKRVKSIHSGVAKLVTVPDAQCHVVRDVTIKQRINYGGGS